MWPGFDQIVKVVSWTSSRSCLAMAYQFVCACNLVIVHSPIYQFPGCSNCCCIWHTCVEITDEAYSDTLRIIVGRMCSSFTPAATFVYVTILTNHKIVSYVAPFFGIYVIILEASHSSLTDRLRCTCSAIRMMNYHIWGWILSERVDSSIWWSSTPLCPGNDVQGTFEGQTNTLIITKVSTLHQTTNVRMSKCSMPGYYILIFFFFIPLNSQIDKLRILVRSLDKRPAMFAMCYFLDVFL